MKIRVVIADDHPSIVAGVHHELSAHPYLQIVGMARDFDELLELLDTQACDVLVTDYFMPGSKFESSMLLLTHLMQKRPHLKVIIFTTLDNPALYTALLEIGVLAVFNKSVDVGVLASSIYAAYHDNKLPSPSSSRLTKPNAQRPPLSVREKEVIVLFTSGLSINEIAKQLGRTKQTISSQKASAMRKLGIHRDADLFRFARETGFMDVQLKHDELCDTP